MELNQLIKLIEDWDIESRILEKISIWNLRCSLKKVKAVPVKFLRLGMIYLFGKHFRNQIKNYQDVAITLELKQLYTNLFLSKFKQTTFFEITLIILTKLFYYFMVNRFYHLLNESQIQQQQLYRSLVYILLGYEMESKAYSIVQNQYKHPKNRKETAEFTKAILSEITLSLESMQKFSRNTNKLHRKGVQNLYIVQQAKDVEKFRLEIHETLQARKTAIDIAHTPKSISPSQTPKVNDKSVPNWSKGNHQKISANQLSAAMSIHEGIQLNKNKANIHLSRRKQLKYLSVRSNTKLDNKASMKRSMIGSNAHKDWNSIVGKLKQQQKENNPTKTQAKQYKSYVLSKLQKPCERKLSISKHLKKIEQSFDVRQQAQQLEFKMTNDNDFTTQFNHVSIGNGVKTPSWVDSKLSSSTFFAKSKHQFEKDCQARNFKVLQNNCNLPRLDRH